MPDASIPFILIGFGILGCTLLGFVVALGNSVTNAYADYTLPGNPVIYEYDFRIGGRYGLVTLTILFEGLILGIGGNALALKLLYSTRQPRRHEREGGAPETTTGPSISCPQCNKQLPHNAKFCPRCGTDLP